MYVVLPRERPGAQHNYHLFPVLLRNRIERDAMMRAMWEQFVDSSKIYSDVVDRCRRFGYQGGCPASESVAERLITIPNYATLTHEDVDWVAQAFLSSLADCRKWQTGSNVEGSELLDSART